MQKLNEEQKLFMNQVRSWFHRYNLDPVLKMHGSVIRIGKRFSISHLHGTDYILVDSDPTSATRGAGPLDCLLRAIVGKFTCFSELSCNQMDKKAVRVLIDAGLVTKEFLQKQLINEYHAAMVHAQRQMNMKSRRLGLGTIRPLK